MDPDMIAKGFAWYLVFVFSTVLHEASHALAAMKLGDRTAYEGGQVTLDPIPHIRREFFGMVIIPIATFFYYRGFWMIGWASAPYDPMWARQFPKRAAAMALAGPLANLSLLIVSGLLVRIGLFAGVFEIASSPADFTQLVVASEGGLWKGIAMILGIFFWLNTILFLFNLLPVPPLDGSAIIQFFMPDRVARRYQDLIHQPMFAMGGLLIAWFLFARVVFFLAAIVYTLLLIGA